MNDVDKKKDAGMGTPVLTSADLRFVVGLLTKPAAQPKSGFLAAREMHNKLIAG